MKDYSKFLKINWVVLALLISTSVFAQPDNDEICNATPLSISVGCTEATNVNATVSEAVFTPSCWNAPISSDVWFTFIATVPGMTVSTDLQGLSLTNTQVAVYKSSDNSCVGTLTEIGCDEDGGYNEPNNSIINLNYLVPGDVYYIRVDGSGSATGTFCISVSDTYTPGSTSCEAQVIYPNNLPCTSGFFGGSANNGNFAENTLSPPAAYAPLGVDYCGGDDETNQYGAWVTFVATTTEISITNRSGGNREHTLFWAPNAKDCSTLNCDSTYSTTNNGTATISGLTLGEKYYILTTLTGGATTTGFSTDLCFQSTYDCVPPSNDDCANAQTIEADKLYGVSTYCASSDSPPSVCKGTSIDNNIWFNWTTPNDWTGDAFFQLFNQNCTPGSQSNGSQAFVYSPGLKCGDVADCSGGTTSNNDAGNQSYDNNITAVWTPVPGETYLINFDGYAGEVCTMQFQVTSSASTKVVSVNSTEICPGESAWLYASGASAYTWSTGETTDSILVSPTVTTSYVVSAAGNEIGTAVGFVIVKPVPSLSSDLNPKACSGQLFDYEPTSSTPLSSFTWTRDAVAGISNSSAAGVGNPNEVLVNTTKDTINVKYVFVSTAKSCTNGPDGDTVVVAVRPEATIPTIYDTICNRETFEVLPLDGVPTVATQIPGGTKYIWSTPAVNPVGTVTGGSAETIPQDKISQTLVNSTFAMSTVTYTVTPIVDGCEGAPFEVEIAVRPSDDASFSYALSTYCDDDNTADSTAIITGLTGGTFSSLGSLIILDPSTGRFGLSTSPLGSDSVKYVTNGTCPDSSYFRVTITDGPDATFAYSDPSFCQNTLNPSPLYGAGASAGVFTVNPLVGLDFVSTKTGEIDLFTSLPGTYTVTNTIAAAGSCPANIDDTVVIINQAPMMVNPSTAQTICSGSTLNISLTPDILSALIWKTTNNTNITGESTTNKTSNTIADALINTSLSAQTVTYTITPTSLPEACLGTPQLIDVIVNPKPQMTSSASTITICSNDTISRVLTTDVPSTLQWLTLNNSNILGESTSPQTSDTLSNALANTSTTQQVLTYSITPTSVLGSCVGNTQTIDVKVNPNPKLINDSVFTICSEGIVSVTLNADVASSYTWRATDNTNVTGETTGQQANANLIDTLISSSLVPEGVTYIGTARSTGGGCLGTPQTLNVTVNPKPVMTSTDTSTICSGDTVNIPLASDVASTFNWQAIDGSNTTGEITSAQATDTIINVIENPTTAQQTVSFNATPTSTLACIGNTQTLNVTVNPNPTMVSETADTVCGGGDSINIVLMADIPSTYIWKASDNSDTDGESLTDQTRDTINDAIINNSGVNQTLEYTVIPTSTVGSCIGEEQMITIQIAQPVAAFTYNPENGTPSLAVDFTNESESANTYEWIYLDENGLVVGRDTTYNLDPMSHSFTAPSIYTTSLVSTYNFLCPDTVSSEVIVYKLVVSNVFSPNGDNINDEFEINARGLTRLGIKVYNRWGVLVYESNALRGKWDGYMTNGKLADDGTYYYLVEAEGVDGQEYSEKGFVTIVK